MAQLVRARPRAERLPPDPAPAALYLTRLGPGSRKAQALALERIVRIASAGTIGAVELDWTALGYAECQATGRSSPPATRRPPPTGTWRRFGACAGSASGWGSSPPRRSRARPTS